LALGLREPDRLFLGGSTELDVERVMPDRRPVVPVDDDQLRLTTFALPGDVITVNNSAAILLSDIDALDS